MDESLDERQRMSGREVGRVTFSRDLAMRALDSARVRGASYADVRYVRRRVEQMAVRNGHVDSVTGSEDMGFSVRAIAEGSWGFAASQQLTPREADRVGALAVEVPLDARLDLLLRADAAMRDSAELRTTRASAEIWREDKLFASTEGALIEQTLFETGCGIEAEPVGDSEMQRRSYPNSGARHQNTGGWEFVVKQDLVGNAARVAEEAKALLTAKPCPQDIRTTVILSGNQVALQVHESCGHPIELDRALGSEAAYAGMSFLTPDRLGSFRYGSDQVNIQIDSVSPGGLGTFGYDDEGVPASKGWAIREGVFVGYLMSRETAARMGLASNGSVRADGWARLPLIRMTNVSLTPGTWKLDDLIADTDDGIYMDTNRSWSIDDRRLNFQFGTEIAWEIKNGKKGQLLRNATYTGITPEFWGSCDAVCDASDWTMWGTPNCGKGQPGQVAHTGHGASAARFRNVRVGVVS